ALEWAASELRSGRMSRATFVADLTASDEFAHVRVVEDALALAARARADDTRPRGLTAPSWSDERLIEIPWVLARYRNERLFADAGLEIFEDEVYALGHEGWSATDGEAADARYGTRGGAASAVYCVELRAFEESRVAAAAGGADAEDDGGGE